MPFNRGMSQKPFSSVIVRDDFNQSARIDAYVAESVIHEMKKLRAENNSLRRDGKAKREAARQTFAASRKKKGGRA